MNPDSQKLNLDIYSWASTQRTHSQRHTGRQMWKAYEPTKITLREILYRMFLNNLVKTTFMLFTTSNLQQWMKPGKAP